MRSLSLSGLLLLAVASACRRTPDPLDASRATCRALAESQQLRPGLSVESCAANLKVASDARDPDRRADELIDRASTLLRQQGPVTPTSVQPAELRAALRSLEDLGQPAVSRILTRFQQSSDPDLRLALAKVLVSACADECHTGRMTCMVPALMEGLAEGRPTEVQLRATRGLASCTGQDLGESPEAWRAWWASRRPLVAAESP